MADRARRATRSPRRSRPPALVRPGDPDVWDLRLLAGEERLRLGGHFDGILDKRAVIRYPARALVEGDAARRLRPYYTRENRLSVRSTPISVEEAQRKPPPARERPEGPSRPTHENPGLRRRLELAAMGALQKTASLLLRLAIGRRKRRAPVRNPQKVHVLLMNAYGMGGTIRTTLNLVEELAGTHEVELISVIRRRAQPLFEFPPGIEVSTVDDRRGAALAGESTRPGRAGAEAHAERARPSGGLGVRRLERLERPAAGPEAALARGRRADHDAAGVQRDRGEARSRAGGDGRTGAPQLQRPPARGSGARSSATTRSSTPSSC